MLTKVNFVDESQSAEKILISCLPEAVKNMLISKEDYDNFKEESLIMSNFMKGVVTNLENQQKVLENRNSYLVIKLGELVNKLKIAEEKTTSQLNLP